LITDIPDTLVNLTHIICSDCSITHIPHTLINLRKLRFWGCPNITEIPKELVNLTKLDCLYCKNIKEIPIELVKLEKLNCRNCPNLTFAPLELINSKKTLSTIDRNYQKYRREGCKKLVDTILEELIQRTWEPKRAIKWCWDEEEKKFMGGYFELTCKTNIKEIIVLW
jgi:hypothetical protein